MPLPRHNLPSIPLPSTRLLTLISQHHPGSMLAPVASVLCPLWQIFCFAPRPAHSACFCCAAGPRQSFSRVRGFAKWRGRWVEDCGKLSYLKVSAICAVELGGGVYRLRCSGFAHQPPHTLAARGCRQVMSPSEPLYPRV